MSAFRKLFIAAALLATGLGVAYLLGEPVSIKQALDSPRLNSQAPPTVAPALSAPATAWAANRVQLLPDSVVTQNSVSCAGSAVVAVAAGSDSLGAVVNVDSQFAQSVAVNDTPATPRYVSATPRANLRNEAPRPIGNEPRSPATIRRTPPVTSESGDPASGSDAYKVMSTWPASPQLLPAGFASDGNATAATTASYDTSAKTTDNRQVAPPPWPAREESSEPRMHVIVDGDSLEKLAGRYLDDPHRSAEIFELNREVLSSPDLLPIGEELKIPERATRTSWDRQGRRAGFPNDASVREAANGNLVPVRPISSYDGVIPRAQLARPVRGRVGGATNGDFRRE